MFSISSLFSKIRKNMSSSIQNACDSTACHSSSGACKLEIADILFERPRPRRDVLFASAGGFPPNAAVAIMNSTFSGLMQDV